MQLRKGPFSSSPRSSWSSGQDMGKEVLGRAMLVLVSFMSFSNWEAKQVPCGNKGLVLEI